MKTVFGNSAPLPGNNEPINPMDLVVQLGRTIRFNGSITREYSVLHHSVLCAILWLKTYGPEGVEHALAHDFHEYVTSDIPSPVKAAIGREHIDRVQNELDIRIYESVAAPMPDPVDRRLVKIIDWCALFIEAAYIGSPDHIQHMVDEHSFLHLSPEDRDEIWGIVVKVFPKVAEEMTASGFFTCPYEPK